MKYDYHKEEEEEEEEISCVLLVRLMRV